MVHSGEQEHDRDREPVLGGKQTNGRSNISSLGIAHCILERDSGAAEQQQLSATSLFRVWVLSPN